ncbi:MAG TPA: serine/threonine-protein kinase [Pyrinomonadaceae bacterium]|nr:serine/threonine-protein kinase [Pyrinomonadaceae bacterium]
MAHDKSQLETVTLNETSAAPLSETTMPRAANLAGQLLDDRYQIEKELGHGGVGVVYLARDRKLHDKRVVIKILLDKSLDNSWVVQKFQQEKEALARVDHPGVVGILDTGELPDGKPYLVMQFIDGVTLRSQIKTEGIPLDRAAEIIRQTGRALAVAHDKGVFHRDLKPENIMLQSFAGGEEQVKIIDFGIAKLKNSTVAPSTMTGATAGTVAYMAPEQLSGRPTSAATDVYAFGAIAFEILTGRKPFNPETGFELLEMQRNGVRVSPIDLRPAVTQEANDLILRALNFDPSVRFRSACEFGDALAHALLDGETREQKQVAPAAIPATQLATQANQPARQTADLAPKTIAGRYEPAQLDALSQPSYVPAIEDEPKPRTGTKIAIALTALLLIVVVAGLLMWKRNAIVGSRAAERSLAYSLTVQKMRDSKPYQGEFESSGQEIFENGWKFRMNLNSPQEGYLYLLNEGPADGDVTTYNVLFPETETNGGSPRVNANQKLQTAWMRFDDNQGTEKFWMVWSATPVKELEAVTDAVNERDRGEIKDRTKARTVRDFLKQHSSPKPDVTKDSTKKQTIVGGQGNMLVNLIELEHH